MTVGALIGEPLAIHKLGAPSERPRRVAELMEMVGLRRDQVSRYPHEFSGGQRQREGARLGAGADRAGRAGLGPGRLDPGPDPPPAGGSPAAAGPDLPDDRPRSGGDWPDV